jgi:hypothetical protein
MPRWGRLRRPKKTPTAILKQDSSQLSSNPVSKPGRQYGTQLVLNDFFAAAVDTVTPVDSASTSNKVPKASEDSKMELKMSMQED